VFNKFSVQCSAFNVRIVYTYRCFSDVKTVLRISIATGLIMPRDLEILLENSGSVSYNFD